ncbi:DsbA family protein [uncultured Rhodoblastus sp.]|uniref:DsbA family protein n=1 Tax=uncultured Rhodoblastus sp. TaxID=543037 RepID=UPI0025FD9B7D|nr:DsbA family protein [uncultured Rhodoblastus sp.]
MIPPSRRVFLAAVAGLFVAPARAARLFDIYASDGTPLRNFAIDPALAPGRLAGLIETGGAGRPLLVEFFDYACGPCRRAASEIEALLASAPELRLGLAQHPVLGPGSIATAKVALAAQNLAGGDSAWRLHRALLQAPGPASVEKALAIGAEQGLDGARLKQASASESVAEILAAHGRRAFDLSLPQTPSFVLEGFALAGWPGVEPMLHFIAALKNCGGLQCPPR